MAMPDPSIVRFRRAVASAYAELEGRRQEVNDLNVFPVADGDTGDNMAMTLRAVLSELDRINGQHIDEVGRGTVVDAVARAALLGARGNSGVILSQIVRGAAEELASRPGELIDPILVSAAFARDAGAYGLTVIIAGVIAALRGDSTRPQLEHQHVPDGRDLHLPQHESSVYRYCTNFAVTGSDLDGPSLVPRLEEIGDSVLVVGDRRTLKVHVHTDEPDTAVAIFESAPGSPKVSRLDVAD